MVVLTTAYLTIVLPTVCLTVEVTVDAAGVTVTVAAPIRTLSVAVLGAARTVLVNVVVLVVNAVDSGLEVAVSVGATTVVLA